MLAAHIFSDKDKIFSKKNSGYARVIEKIAIELSKTIEVEVMTYLLTKSQKYNGIKFNEVSISKILFSLKLKKLMKNIEFIIELKNYKFKEKIILLIKLCYEDYFYKKIILEKPDFIHINGLIIEMIPFIKATIRSKTPFIITLHGMNYNNLEVIKNNIKIKEFEIEMLKEINRQGIPITVLTNTTKQKIIEEIFKFSTEYDENKIYVIPNGIDKQYKIIKETSKKIDECLVKESKKIKILSVGSLVERKNQIFLLDSLKYLSKEALDKVVVIICGDGPTRKKLENYTRENNLQNNVLFLGNVDNNNLKKLYKESSFLSMTSTTEGFGLPVLEALIHGKYILSIEGLEFIEEIKNQPFCLTIKNRNPKEYADLIDKALKIKVFDTEAIDKFLEEYYWDVIIKKYLEVYNIKDIDIEFNIKKIEKTLNKLYKY